MERSAVLLPRQEAKLSVFCNAVTGGGE
jgi:hypothetical protein